MITRISSLLSFFTLLMIAPAMAQKAYNYDTAWKKVENFLQKNLPKSAGEQAEKIYTQAKKDGQQAQQVKALVYKSQLINQVEENNWYKNVQAFEKETAAAKEPVQQILHSLSADLYYQYYQNQRWKIYNRTATTGIKKDDPETWTAEDFHEKIAAHYQASLKNAALLQQSKLDKYAPIIIKGNQRALRPTLFDLLAHKALDYFKSDERDITQPAYQFQLSDMANLADVKTFIRYKYESKDSSSVELAAIRIYQQLLSFHSSPIQGDGGPLVDVDIDRIVYAHSHSVNEAKEQLYKEALEHIYNQYPTLPQAMQAGYLLAAWWQERGNNYQPATGTPEDKNALATAAEIAKEVFRKVPESDGGYNAYNLLNELNRPSLSMQAEKVNLINQPFRSLVKFKNINAISLRLIKVDETLDKQLTSNEDYEENKYWKLLLRQKAVREWSQPLPATTDYREHSTEIKVDGLPTGKYILLSSQSKAFGLDKNPLAATVLYVSNISFINNNNSYFILHRQTGQPLGNAKVQVWQSSYDYNARNYKQTKLEQLKADKNGFMKIAPDKDAKNRSRNIRLEITHNGDRLYMTDDIYNYSYYNDNKKLPTEQEAARYFIFMDRSIYRPAQTVYFKAIGITQKPGDKYSSLYLPKTPVTVQLKDANGQIVDTLAIVPNEYGSISGSFKLPASGLTGNFTLVVMVSKKSNQYQARFNVEEYKRPKFMVEFEKPKGTYELNDSITITGTAKAYAGNNIDGATVKYTVKRNTRFLYPWLFWGRKTIWPPYGNNNDMEITQGETTTDADGKFRVNFKAIPDLSTDKKLDPSFDYTIEADVTDINGETRSSSQSVSVGYKSLLLNIYTGGLQQTVDSFKNIRISSTNLAGEAVPSLVSVKIYQLKTPDRLIRERFWEQADTSVMSYAEYIQLFPNDEYGNESDYHTWAKGKLVQEDTLTAANNSPLPTHHSLKAGWYLIEATTKDKKGNEVKAMEYVALADMKNNQLPAPAYNFAQAIKSTVEPGEKPVFYQNSAASNLFVIQQVQKSETDEQFDFLTNNNQLSTNNFSATEAERGGYTINRFFVKDNRLYTTNWQVNIPWTNKQLNISFETFRNKLLPGQEEKWKVKISGYKGDAVAGEMLASMYDASLDQYKSHYWNPLSIWPYHSYGNGWNGRNNFEEVNSTEKPLYEEGKYFDKRYDELISIESREVLIHQLLKKMPGVQVESLQSSRIGVRSIDGVLDNGVVAAPTAMAKKMDVKFTPTKIVADEMVKEDEQPAMEGVPGNNNTPEIPVQIRKNFNETAFFFPDLHTNEKGEIEFSFTIPEALTEWKLQTLAHTKDLQTAMATQTVVTQKELMVQPNAPRFFRQGDKLSLVAKIANISDKDISGTATLEMMNTSTNQPVNGQFGNQLPSQPFTVKAGQSAAVNFPLSIPMDYNNAVSYRITASGRGTPLGDGGTVSDGEEMALPVLTNRMLVTESFPLNLRGTNSKSFVWERFIKLNEAAVKASPNGGGLEGAGGLVGASLTVEYTSNPAWYAVQALPYLMEYPYDCAEQTWNRFYANALAGKIANSTPKIKAIFEQWKSPLQTSPSSGGLTAKDNDALLSNLQKNEELKAVLLEETPWVLQAKNEAEQKKNIALLFDMVRMSAEAEKAMAKLKDLQSSNGGLVWFKGGPDDRYMTQYIATGIGHLQKLNAWPANQQNALQAMVSKALPYLDARIKEDYDNLIKYKTKLDQDNLSATAIQYLYMRSFFTQPVEKASQTAYQYYVGQAAKYWTSRSKYEQGMIALAMHRSSNKTVATAVLKSLTENSIANEEFGMYWKEFNTGGYYWWQAPIESHSLLIEAYSEIENNTRRVDDLKTWLLKQKQTQDWRTTKATADACYALLLQGSNWLAEEKTVSIQLGNTTVRPDKTEAGTGYFKSMIEGKNVTPEMGNITISQTNTGTPPSGGWGAIYWQYFQDLDKITTAATPLQLNKKLFVVSHTDRGEVITPLADNGSLKIGDRVKVRIELRSDRNLEYVHLKDMRASCFEPVNVLSRYKYQDGLGYYEATKDASTNFFISYLNKGTYVFEYELLVSHAGNFSNGISSIQCMYAPEFTAHSEGIRVNVK